LERNPAAARLTELLGNVTFLERPFHPTTLVSVVQTGPRGRRRQYECQHLNEELESRVEERTSELAAVTTSTPVPMAASLSSCRCMPIAPYRPARSTFRPVVQGTQTAVVVGPSGEEIFTDKYGRVKVQFHWDRDGKNDADSSCWVRVGQNWAGKRWGASFWPRIGQEVIVFHDQHAAATQRRFRHVQRPPESSRAEG